MRTIAIELHENDNAVLTTPQRVYLGEHRAAQLKITLPQRMSSGFNYYTLCFDVMGTGRHVPLGNVYPVAHGAAGAGLAYVQDGIIYCQLPEQITRNNYVQVQIEAHIEENGRCVKLEKSAPFLLFFEEGIAGEGDVLSAFALGHMTDLMAKYNQAWKDLSTPGPQGEKGDKGDPGSKGDQGPPGQKGDKGDKGDQGQPGEQGTPGQKGDKGDPGEKGEIGETGEKGDPGTPGIGIDYRDSVEKYADLPTQATKGDAYYVRADGLLYICGDSGFPAEGDGTQFKGDKGDPGEKGEKGDIGATGPQGTPGPKGDQGPKGQDGATGQKGDKGDQGVKGDQGPEGKSNPFAEDSAKLGGLEPNAFATAAQGKNADNAVRFNAQELTSQQKEQARSNIDAAEKAWVQPAVNDRNNPATWETTGEIDFGDGTFGMRRQGTITAAAGARNVTTLGTPSVMVNIISSGGWISFDGTARYALNGSYVRANTDTLPSYFSALAQSSARNITMATLNTYAARTDAPYDVWIRYAK